MLEAAFLDREHFHRFVDGADRVEQRLSIVERDLRVALTMRDEIGTFDLLGDTGQSPVLQLFKRCIQAGDAEYPHDVVARHGERTLEGLVDTALPDGIIIPDGAP